MRLQQALHRLSHLLRTCIPMACAAACAGERICCVDPCERLWPEPYHSRSSPYAWYQVPSPALSFGIICCSQDATWYSANAPTPDAICLDSQTCSLRIAFSTGHVPSEVVHLKQADLHTACLASHNRHTASMMQRWNFNSGRQAQAGRL